MMMMMMMMMIMISVCENFSRHQDCKDVSFSMYSLHHFLSVQYFVVLFRHKGKRNYSISVFVDSV